LNWYTPLKLSRIFRTAPALLLVLTFTLSGCQSSEEKAEGYYQSGLALIAKGDEDRALVEFRNVFKYNGFHKDARKAYADILLKRGETSDAYAQYLRLIEQYPDMVEVRQIMAELALGLGNWDEVERHGTAALAIAPDVPGVQAIGLALEYRKAVLARDATAKADVVTKTKTLLEVLPANLGLRRILIDSLLQDPDPHKALAEVDKALEYAPTSFEFMLLRLRLLSLAQDIDGVGEQLKKMVALFPENEEAKTSLIRWYMQKRDFAGAEAFLRAQAGADTAPPKNHLSVVQLLNVTQSRDAGRAELARLIAANAGTPNADFFGAFLATMLFEDGNAQQAIAALDAILAKAEPSDQTRNIMAMQARMLDKTGEHDKAEALITKILAADASNVDALKLRAVWSIAGNRIGEAIVDLRAAQGQAPRDPQIMTLLASAYNRDGSLDLSGEQLAKAYEASNAAPEEALRYAGFLRSQGRLSVAETVLTDAKRNSPTNISILSTLADVLLESNKWPLASEIAATLRQIDTPQSTSLAAQLQAAILLGQNRVDEGLALLENQASESTDDVRPSIVVALTQLRAGKTIEARNFLDDALTKHPGDRQIRLLMANVDAILGNADLAETEYRALIAENPNDEQPIRLLYGLLIGADRSAEAHAVLDAGLAAQPENETLLWIKAALLERENEIDGAIEIYEQLYARNSGNIVTSNNLASMITSYRDDAASLERAATIARRLRSSDVPAFQDTYGWIEYRRGNLDEAILHLKPAANGLPNDLLAQFHFGMALADLGRKDEAIIQFRRVLELGEGKTLPQIETAQKRLTELTTSP
jgi:cellulose synthase operon protein C